MLVDAHGGPTRDTFSDHPYRAFHFSMPADGSLTVDWGVQDRSQPSCDVSIDVLTGDGAHLATLLESTTVQTSAGGNLGPFPTRGGSPPFGNLEPGRRYAIAVTTTCALWTLRLSGHVDLRDSVLLRVGGQGRGVTSKSVKIPADGQLFLHWSTSDATAAGCSIDATAESSGGPLATLLMREGLSGDQDGEEPVTRQSDGDSVLGQVVAGTTYQLFVVSDCESWHIDLIKAIPVQ